jgi:hypothetical protein
MRSRTSRALWRPNLWIILVAVVAFTGLTFLVFWLGGSGAPLSDPATSGSTAGRGDEGVPGAPADADSPPAFALAPGARPFRSMRRGAPDKGARSSTPALPAGDVSRAAYSLGALPREWRAGESRDVLVMPRSGQRITRSLIDKSYSVRYVPSSDLELPLMKARGAWDRVGFEVQPFAQLPVRSMPGISNVESGGEILALAVARQLGQMELAVKLHLTDSMARRLRASRPDRAGPAGGDRLASSLRSSWEKLGSRRELSGKMRFWVTERRGKTGQIVTAHIIILPAVAGCEARAETGEAVSGRISQSAPIFDRETLTGPGSGTSTGLRHEAARRVLQRAVVNLLGAALVEKTVLGFIRDDSPESRGRS